MPRCGCDSAACACVIEAGENTTVTGTGSADNPYVISASAGGGDTQVVDRMAAIAAPGVPDVPADLYNSYPTNLVLFDALSDVGTALEIDGSDDTIVRTLIAGAYAVTASYAIAVASSNRGMLGMDICIDVDGVGARAYQGQQMVADGQQMNLGASLTWWSPANGKIQISLNNQGSVAQPVDDLFVRVQRVT